MTARSQPAAIARAVLRNVAWLCIALCAVYAFGVVYAWLARAAQSDDTPFGMLPEVVVSDEIVAHLTGMLTGDLGVLPGKLGPVAPFVAAALGRSLLVLGLAFVISAALGIVLTFVVGREQGRSPRWFVPLAVLLTSVPPFLVSVLATAIVIALSWDFIPVQSHWLLPVLVLAIRPAVQVARVLSGLVVEQFDQQYVVAARGLGNSWAGVRRHHVWPNILAPAIMSLAGNFRILVAELVVIEWLLNWPGVGRLLASALIVPKRTDSLAPLFLHPHLTAMTFTAVALLFLVADLVARNAAPAADPRLRESIDPLRRAHESAG